jgi:hypothetical protein
MFARVERKAKDGPSTYPGDMPEVVQRVERMYFDRDGGVYTIRGEGSNEFQDAMYDGDRGRRYIIPDDFWDEVDRGELFTAMAFPENAEEQAHLQELTGGPVPIVPMPPRTTARAPRPSRAVLEQPHLAPKPALGRPGQPERGKRLLGDPPMQSHEARELTLHAANNERLWNRRRTDFLKNSIRRKVAGTYDSDKAVKLWEYFADEVARDYVGDFGGSFTKAQKREAAREFRDGFEAAWDSGELRTYYPDLFPKGATVAKKKTKKKSTRKKPRTAAQKRATKKLVAANKKKAKKKATKKRTKKKATKKRAKKKASRSDVMKKARAAKRKGKKRSAVQPKTVYIM